MDYEERKARDETIGRRVRKSSKVAGVLGASAASSMLLGAGGALIDGKQSIPTLESEGDAAFVRMIEQKYLAKGPNGTFSDEQVRDAFEMYQARQIRDKPERILAEEQLESDRNQAKNDPVAQAKIAERAKILEKARIDEQNAWAQQQKDKDLAQYLSEKEKIATEHTEKSEKIKTDNALHDTAENIGYGAGALLPVGFVAGRAWSAREEKKAALRDQHRSVVALG